MLQQDNNYTFEANPGGNLLIAQRIASLTLELRARTLIVERNTFFVLPTGAPGVSERKTPSRTSVESAQKPKREIPLYRDDRSLIEYRNAARIERLEKCGLLARVVRHKKGTINRAIMIPREGEPKPTELRDHVGQRCRSGGTSTMAIVRERSGGWAMAMNCDLSSCAS